MKVEVNPVFSIVEKNGMSEEITALYEELRGLGLLCVCRSAFIMFVVFTMSALFIRISICSLCQSCLEKVRLIRSQVEKQRADREALQETMMY